VGDGGVELGLGRVEGRFGACCAEVGVGEGGWLVWWRGGDAWWWRERCVVGFAVAEEGEGQLGVCGDAFEDCAVRGGGVSGGLMTE
jgi:hypothetical protein